MFSIIVLAVNTSFFEQEINSSINIEQNDIKVEQKSGLIVSSYKDTCSKTKDLIIYTEGYKTYINSLFYVTHPAGTGSMYPTIKVNTTLLMKKYQNEDLCVGDIIEFKKDGKIFKLNSTGNGDKTVLHRIIKQGEDSEGVYYGTRGDNNKYEDNLKIRKDDIIGYAVFIGQ